MTSAALPGGKRSQGGVQIPPSAIFPRAFSSEGSRGLRPDHRESGSPEAALRLGYASDLHASLRGDPSGMTVILTRRADINLDSFRRVAWQGEGVRLSDTALQVIAACRRSFLQLIDKDPDLVIYGVTTATGELASRRLGAEERDRHARLKPFAAATSFGDPLPDRVVRGIVLARLANFIEGNAATTPRIADAVAAMLEGGPM